MMEELYEWMQKVARILDDHKRVIDNHAKVLQEMREENKKLKEKENNENNFTRDHPITFSSTGIVRT